MMSTTAVTTTAGSVTERAIRPSCSTRSVAGIAVALVSGLLTSGCTESGSDALLPGGQGLLDDTDHGLVLAIPDRLAQSRAVDPTALSLEVRVDGTSLEPTREGSAFVVSTVLPPNANATLEVVWREAFEGADLDLASWSGDLGPITAAETVTLDPSEYLTSVFDEDEDGVSNLDEREAGTDPRVAADAASVPGDDDSAPPLPADETNADVVIRAFDAAAGVPQLDGAYEPVWEQAQFENTAGELLRIDNLAATSESPEAGDGEPDYQWFAMHDGEFLYLFVQFESVVQTPIRDSDDLRDDDSLHVFTDGDGSRGRTLDGVDGDDRYFAIPLVSAAPGGFPEPIAPSPEAPTVPPSLEFGVCLCEGNRSGWEMRIALADLGFEVGRPFGLEIQLDQDSDGGTREARWSWYNPSVYDQDDGFVFESPAYHGKGLLEPPP